MSQDSIPDIETIKATLNRMAGSALATSAKELLATLGYKSERILPGQTGNPHELIGDLPDTQAKQEFVEQAQTTHLIFQITDSELSQASLFVEDKVDKGQLQSYVFIAITLKGEDYSRTSLARMTRLLNKQFPMPVMVLFRYGAEDSQQLSIAIINRRHHQRDEDKDVLGKVTLIHGINLISPHRGHLDILASFSVARLKKHQTINNFDTLHTAWEEVFDVQLLNKQFYRQLSDWYFWALSQVQFPDDVEQDTGNRNATNLIRLLTRLIFCWFLKEKGLIPSRLFEQDKLSSILKSLKPEESTFYHAILQNLFFATLNQKMDTDSNGNPKRKFAKDVGFQRNRNDHGLYNLYRYESLFQGGEDAALKEFADIPFLNGGLFECLDHEDGNNKVQYVDGFSRNLKKQARVPNELFFGEVRTVDLSELYDDKTCKNQRVGGLIPILNAYKFTIVENTPVDQEIALDPELLGMVFENLLASYNPETKTTARKQTGSFYTPRPIVDYMVDESLKAHLATALTRDAAMGEADATAGLEMLFTYTEKEHPFTPHEAKALIGAIDTCKILDPACGSGAFPMGALHKLVFILQKLDPHNEQWKRRQIETAENILDIQARDSAIQAIKRDFEDNELDYGRKLYLIENCLYGVDIQPIAIQIAKLRFFISLVCDQKINRENDNYGIRPLPNLETKFVVANTLIRLDIWLNEDVKIDFFKSPKIVNIEKELQRIRHEYFALHKRQQKLSLQREDKRLRNELMNELIQASTDQEISQKLARWNPYDPHVAADFFEPLWMFDHSIADGFDLIIGNPPYIKEYTNKNAFDHLKILPYYQGKMDIWYLFACNALDNLKKWTGILCFIATNNWITSAGASKLRRKIACYATILRFIDFVDYKVFGSADIQTMILLARNTSEKEEYLFDLRRLNKNNATNDGLEYLHPVFNRRRYVSSIYSFADSALDEILNSMSDMQNFILNKQSEITQGIVASQDFVNQRSARHIGNGVNLGDGVFVLSSSEKDALTLNTKEKLLVRPYYRANELKKYYGTLNNLFWIIYTDSSYSNPKKMDDLPNLRKHLDKYADIITSHNAPYGLHRARKEYFFLSEKIISLRKCSSPTFTYVDFDCYVSQTFNIIKTSRTSLKYLTALLNSSLIAFWLRYRGKMQGHNFQVDSGPLLSVPIYIPDKSVTQCIENLVDLLLLEISQNNQKSADIIQFLQNMLDACIYQCYFHDHMQKRNLLFHSKIADLLNEFNSDASREDQLKFLEHFYQTANAPDHPIRNRLLRLTADSPNLLGVIRGASVI